MDTVFRRLKPVIINRLLLALYFFQDLLESGNKIVKGALGVILNHEGWEKKVEEAKTLEEMVIIGSLFYSAQDQELTFCGLTP